MSATLALSSLGKYQIKALIKQGAIATVYRAFEPVLERDVAIKILNENQLTGDTAETLCQHFDIAVKAAAQCQQPNVISIHDYARHEQQPYLVMDYLSGGNLEELLILKKQSLNQEQAIKLVLKVLEALHGLHQQGIIHSGIKPSTILLPAGFSSNIALNLQALKITAFGTAFMTNNVAHLNPLDSLCLYSAPELRHGNPISVRSDLYAAAAVLLQLLVQKPLSPELFDDDALQQALHGKKVTANLIQIVSQSLHSKPQQRHYDALEFHQALSRYLTEQSVKAAPRPEPAIVKVAQPTKPSEPAHNELALQREMTLFKENALQRERELEASLQIKESQWQTQMALQQRTAAHTEAALQDELAFYKEAVSKQKEASRLRSSKSIGEQVVKSSGSFWREILVISVVIFGGTWTFLHDKEPEEPPATLQKIKLQPIAKIDKTDKTKNEAQDSSPQTDENTPSISEIAQLIERRYHIKNDVIDDLNTGLAWMRCSLGQKWENGQCTGEAKGYALEQVTYLSQTTKADGWRLPTRDELLTLVYCNENETSITHNDGCGASHVMPTIIDSVFPKTPSFSFWAHSPNATEYGVWGAVEFVNGSYNEVSKNEVFYVRMVRER